MGGSGGGSHDNKVGGLDMEWEAAAGRWWVVALAGSGWVGGRAVLDASLPQNRW